MTWYNLPPQYKDPNPLEKGIPPLIGDLRLLCNGISRNREGCNPTGNCTVSSSRFESAYDKTNSSRYIAQLMITGDLKIIEKSEN
jgi:hypothetical protein